MYHVVILELPRLLLRCGSMVLLSSKEATKMQNACGNDEPVSKYE